MSIDKRCSSIGLRIAKVLKDGIAEEMGLEKGDTILAVNGKYINDLVEYNFLIADEEIEVLVLAKGGEECTLEIEKDFDEDLGVEFENDLLEGAKSCTNKCVFCFIDQLPEGMRESLYFKDDDTRLSFLHGSFVTLTNLKKEDLDKIISYGISPINVSVHTTNPNLRESMLGNKFAGKIIEQIKYLTDNNIRINCQIVLCPSLNDDKELDITISDLSSLYPGVHSVAVVPVGLTSFREELYELKSYDKGSSAAVLKQIKEWQDKFKLKYGANFVYAADEFFIMAEEEIPPYEEYEDFAQMENGVGLLASFEEEFNSELLKFEKKVQKQGMINNEQGETKIYSMAVGEIIYDFMYRLVDSFKLKYNSIGGNKIEINVYKIKNDFFGSKITVSGLITGQDLKSQLKGKILGEKLLISKNMLKQDEDIFLDDCKLTDVAEELEVNIIPISNGQNLVKELIKNTKIGRKK